MIGSLRHVPDSLSHFSVVPPFHHVVLYSGIGRNAVLTSTKGEIRFCWVADPENVAQRRCVDWLRQQRSRRDWFIILLIVKRGWSVIKIPFLDPASVFHESCIQTFLVHNPVADKVLKDQMLGFV